MPGITIDKFKGLRQDIDYPELPPDYCHVLQNLNPDDPMGRLTVREGNGDKYNADSLANYPFTSLISAYEYRFEVSSETVLIVNDNGTLKTMTDGGNPSSLTLPTGAALGSGFKNQYLGYRDHVLITTGNGATNYLLWFGYVDREIDDDKGLFGNVEENTGYILTKAQLICPHGLFSNVYNTAYLDGYYYFTFINSKYIEKRDSNFKLVERFRIDPDDATNEPQAEATPVIDTDGTYIYVAYMHSASDFTVLKINPTGWNTEAEFIDNGSNRELAGICVDSTHVYVATSDASNGEILKLTISDFSTNSTQSVNDIIEICCDTTAGTGYLFLLMDDTGTAGADEIVKRNKSDLSAAGDANDGLQDFQHCIYDSGTIYVSSQTSNGYIYEFDENDLAGGPDSTNVNRVIEPESFVNVGGSNWRVISSKYGTVEAIDAGDTYFPGLIGINHVNSVFGDLDAGTYFYKICIEDLDGQQYTLSDPIVVVHTADNRKANLCIIAHTDYLNDLYRVKYINIYRAYNSVQDIDVPSTDYKFLKRIDINSSEWVSDKTTNEVYYYEYDDNTTEDTISSVTFLESSGIGDTVKPRYVNGKYLTWIDNKLHLGNFSHDGDTYINRIARSADDQPDAIAFYDYYDFDVGDGEGINGISQLYSRSIVFKERKLGVFYDGRWEKNFTPGLSSVNGFYKQNDVLYYVSNKGIHQFDGAKVKNIHYPVITLFEAASSLSDVSVFSIESKDRIIFSIRNDRAFVFNIKYGTWTYYTGHYAFRGFFKNYENEYIGWNQTRFKIIFDDTYTNDSEDYGGGNGTGIVIDYESPLLFGNIKGEAIIPISHRHRILKGTDTITFTLYEHRNTSDGKYSVYTKALDASGSSSWAANQRHFFGPKIGESFSLRLNGTVVGGDFEYHGITLEYDNAGDWYGR